jgi:hypothetical protein
VSTTELFAEDCIIYQNVLNNNEVENLQIYLNRPWEWSFENEIITLIRSKEFISREFE